MNVHSENKERKINVIFESVRGTINVIIEDNKTLEELFNKYIDIIKDQINIYQIDKIRFYMGFNGIGTVKRDDKRTVGEVFGSFSHGRIRVSGI